VRREGIEGENRMLSKIFGPKGRKEEKNGEH
jgi:hypothetical protein